MKLRGLVSAAQWPFLLWVSCFINLSPFAKASISIVDTGITFDSKPDRKVGQRLWKGYEYLGRLQYLDDDLCTTERLTVQQPNDGLPVALLIRNDGCSTTAKAIAASSLIHPPNTVQYLILFDTSTYAQVEGDHNRRFVKELLDPAAAREGESVISNFVSPQKVLLETTELGSYGQQSVTSVDGDGEKIQVAVLHVTHTTGLELLEVLGHEQPHVHSSGGTKILLNAREPAVSFHTVLMWMLVTLIMCSCACCCMLLFMQSNFEEEQPVAPPRPVRRRLTLEQVRARFPAFHFNPEEHHQQQAPDSKEEREQQHYCQLLDECTICLDEFTPGVRCRQLPCKHVFHSTCIARWLIERSAVCPLCKLDLFEEEDDDDDSSNVEVAEPPSQPLSLLTWWGNLTSRGNILVSQDAGRHQIEIPSGAVGISTVAGEGISRRTEEANHQLESRSWWPFSLDYAPLPVQEDVAEIQRQTHSGWRLNWFGQRRSQPPSHSDMLTELTEPLVSGDRDEQAQDHIQIRNTTLQDVSSSGESTSAQPIADVDFEVPPTAAEV